MLPWGGVFTLTHFLIVFRQLHLAARPARAAEDIALHGLVEDLGRSRQGTGGGRMRPDHGTLGRAQHRVRTFSTPVAPMTRQLASGLLPCEERTSKEGPP